MVITQPPYSSLPPFGIAIAIAPLANTANKESSPIKKVPAKPPKNRVVAIILSDFSYISIVIS